jgi:hypothetical protein
MDAASQDRRAYTRLAGTIRAALARRDGELPVTSLQTFAEALAQLGAGLRLDAIMRTCGPPAGPSSGTSGTVTC